MLTGLLGDWQFMSGGNSGRWWEDMYAGRGAGVKYFRTTGLERCNKNGEKNEVHSLLVA